MTQRFCDDYLYASLSAWVIDIFVTEKNSMNQMYPVVIGPIWSDSDYITWSPAPSCHIPIVKVTKCILWNLSKLLRQLVNNLLLGANNRHKVSLTLPAIRLDLWFRMRQEMRLKKWGISFCFACRASHLGTGDSTPCFSGGGRWSQPQTHPPQEVERARVSASQKTRPWQTDVYKNML